MRLRHSFIMMLSFAVVVAFGLEPSKVYAGSLWDTDSDDSDSSDSDWGTSSKKAKKSKTPSWEDEPSKHEDEAQNAEAEGSEWGSVNKKTSNTSVSSSAQNRNNEEVFSGDISKVTEFELRVGVSAPIGATHLSAGVQGNIEIGYRWRYIGLYIQQALGGNFYLEDKFDKKIKKGASAFSGSTYLTAKGLISSKAQKHYFAVIFGVGVTYGNPEYMPFVIPRDVTYPYPGFTLKAGLGYEYRINQDMTLGVSVEYTPYMVGGMDNGNYTFDFYHMIQPNIHFGYTF